MSAYEAGRRFAEQNESSIKKQLENPFFFEIFCREWVEGYYKGISERYPHLLSKLYENPSFCKKLGRG
jgi:hypothetical protein